MNTLVLTIDGAVATLTLNRPDSLNAVDPEMQIELATAWAQIETDPAIRAVVLTGAGRAFCAGSDLKKTMPPAESFASLAFGGTGQGDFLSGLQTEKPVICAINGTAVGGGLELALACDIRLAVPGAKFGLPEVKVGSIPGGGGTQRLPRAIGASDAMLLLLSGDLVDAAEALRMGLISRIVPAETLLAEAQALAARIAANAPLSVRAVKRLVREGATMPLTEAIAHEKMVFGLLRDTEDRIEGRKAFAEKRKPVYRGR